MIVWAISLIFPGALSVQAVILEDVAFVSLPGDKIEMELMFDSEPPEVSGYTIEQPARIALDLEGVNSALKSKYHKIGMGNARTAIVVDAKTKTRIIINLTDLTGYSTRSEGNSLYVLIGQQDLSPSMAENDSVLGSQKSDYTPQQQSIEGNRIVDVDFRRGDQGEGKLLIRLTNPNVPVDISQQSGRIRVEFSDVELAEDMRRRLDVRDFATPIRFIDAVLEDGKQ